MMSGVKMKGTYVLIIELRVDTKIRIGKLGIIQLQKGFYAYIGSALNGLNARIERHIRKEKKFHWHIDYLLDKAKIKEIIYAETNEKKECDIAKMLERNFKSIKNFGSSDCRCESHLFFSGDFKDLQANILAGFNENKLNPRIRGRE